jgi:hypothetical protein
MFSRYRFWTSTCSVVLSVSVNTCTFGVSDGSGSGGVSVGSGGVNTNTSGGPATAASDTQAYLACNKAADDFWKACNAAVKQKQAPAGKTEKDCNDQRESAEAGCAAQYSRQGPQPDGS